MNASNLKKSIVESDSLSSIESELVAWASGTKVIDENGVLIKVYRGEHGASSSLIQTRHGAISFGSKEAAESYAMNPNNPEDIPVNPRIIEAYLSLKNPVLNDNEDPFIDLGLIVEHLGMEKAIQIAVACDSHIKGTDNWCSNFGSEYENVEDLLRGSPEKIRELYVDAYPVFDDHTFVQWFKEAGFDGVIHGGNGETALEPEYKVFSTEQILLIGITNLYENNAPTPHHEIDLLQQKEKAESALLFIERPNPTKKPMM